MQAASRQELDRLAAGKQQLEAQLAEALQQSALAGEARQALQQQLLQLQERAARGQQAAEAAARQLQQDWAARAGGMVRDALQQSQAGHEAQLSRLKDALGAEQASVLESLRAGWEAERAFHGEQLGRAAQEAAEAVDAVRRQYSQLLQDQASAASQTTQQLQNRLRWASCKSTRCCWAGAEAAEQ
jgi:hypothetical protein